MMMSLACIENMGVAPSGTVRLLDIREQDVTGTPSQTQQSWYLARSGFGRAGRTDPCTLQQQTPFYISILICYKKGVHCTP